MSWQLLILINVITFSIGVLLQRLIVKDKKADPIAFSILFQMFVGIIAATYGFAFEDMSLPDMQPLVLNLLLMGVLWAGANIFNFSALKVTEASKFTIIFSTRSIFTAIASGLILGEYLNSRQWIGALFILSGVVLVSLKKAGLKFEKKELLSLMTAMFFGFANTNDRILLKSLNLYPYVALAFIIPAIAVALYKPSSIKNIATYLKPGSIGKVLLVCSIYALSSLAFFKALQIAPNSSQVVTIGISSVIVIVLLSIIFLGERQNMAKKIVGASLSFIGVYLAS